MRLFGGWLDLAKRLQRERYGNEPEEMEGKAYAEYLRLNFTAAVVELGEYMQLAKWKPYKTEGRDDETRAERIEELVDVLHHVANILVLERVTDLELTDAYLAKVEKNRQRTDHKAHGSVEVDHDPGLVPVGAHLST